MKKTDAQAAGTTAKKREFPHSLIIIFLLICVAALMTWIVPAGEYVRVEDANGRMVVDPSSYHRIEQTPVSPISIFEAIPRGLIESGYIAWMVLVIGGSFHVIEDTKATRALVGKFMGKLRGKKGVYLLPVLMLPFFMLPAITGNGESMLAFLPLGILIARSLGFDAMTGLCIVTLASSTGYTTGLFSAFSTGTAQSLVGLPTFSGLWFRIIGAVLLFCAAAFWTVKYAIMVKNDPTKSYCYELEQSTEPITADDSIVELTFRRKLCLVEFFFGICTIVYAALAGWDFKTRFPAIFIIMAVVIGLTGGFTPNQVARSFVDGAKVVLVGALVTGFSKGISLLLSDGHIIDTIVYALSSIVQGMPKQIGAMAMLLVQSILNCFIISSSGQAAATIPIMSPLGDVLGLTQQTVVMAFLYGDGFSNILLPMNASIMGACAISGITYPQYMRRAWRHYVSYMIIGFVMLFIAATIDLGPF